MNIHTRLDVGVRHVVPVLALCCYLGAALPAAAPVNHQRQARLDPADGWSFGHEFAELATNPLLEDAAFRKPTPVGRNVSRDKGLARNVTGVTLNGEGDTSVLRSSLGISTAGALATLLTFCVLRSYNPAVYERIHNDDDGGEASLSVGKPPNTLFDWLYKVWETTPDDEVVNAGLDGWAFLEFYRLNHRILTVMGPFVLAALCPLHFFGTASHPSVADPLSRLDVGSLPPGRAVFWVHAVLVWFVVLVSVLSIIPAHQEFLDRRFEWLKAIPWPRAITVMVENIPEPFRSDEDLRNYFVNFFREDAVESAYIVRKTNRLKKKVEDLEHARYALALARRSWERAGRPPLPSSPASAADTTDAEHAAGGSDAAAGLTARPVLHVAPAPVAVRFAQCLWSREQAAKAVAREQSLVEEAVANRDPKVCSAAGFVTFKTELAQRLASKEQYRRDVTELVLAMPPDPADVIYEHLAEDELGSVTWEWLGWLCLVAVFLFWSPVVVFISSWTTFTAIKPSLPHPLLNLCEHLPYLEAILQGVLATAALKLFLAFLPAILLGIISRFYTLKAGALAQVKLERWYFSFLFLFVLLVTTIGRSFVITAALLVKEPTQIVQLLAASLPSASHFYFNYVILGWFTLTFEMLRVATLGKYWLFRMIYALSPEAAKQYSEPEDQASYGMGSRMALAVLMSAITLVFSTCSPLILAFAWVYFGLGRLTYGYLLVFAETKKPDLGGEFWVEALRQIFLVLFLYVLLMVGVLISHCGDWMGPPMMAGASVLALYWGWHRVNVLAWQSLPLEEVAKASRAKEVAHLRRVGKYIQPECDPELLREDFKEGVPLACA